jgi:hypothetical protein
MQVIQAVALATTRVKSASTVTLNWRGQSIRQKELMTCCVTTVLLKRMQKSAHSILRVSHWGSAGEIPTTVIYLPSLPVGRHTVEITNRRFGRGPKAVNLVQ